MNTPSKRELGKLTNLQTSKHHVLYWGGVGWGGRGWAMGMGLGHGWSGGLGVWAGVGGGGVINVFWLPW